jgi:hypothetical protein
MTMQEPEKPSKFSVGDEVSVVAEGTWHGERGNVVIISDSMIAPYGVVFPWDVTSMPIYFDDNEIERT